MNLRKRKTERENKNKRKNERKKKNLVKRCQKHRKNSENPGESFLKSDWRENKLGAYMGRCLRLTLYLRHRKRAKMGKLRKLKNKSAFNEVVPCE